MIPAGLKVSYASMRPRRVRLGYGALLRGTIS